MKYKRISTIIEAEQYISYGKLVKGMCNSRTCYASGNTSPHVHTIHDNQIVNLELGDYIIPEPDGLHYYPCKPDIFEKTYERIEAGKGDDCCKIIVDWDKEELDFNKYFDNADDPHGIAEQAFNWLKNRQKNNEQT